VYLHILTKMFLVIFIIVSCSKNNTPNQTQATTLQVPKDYATIQAGIDASDNGDTVLVDTGTYKENINFNGKKIVVSSHLLITSDTSYVGQTIIDGGANGSVVTFENGEDSTAVISGFTIKKGLSASSINGGIPGGGIYCINSSPRISHNIIDSNGVNFSIGGGIYCENSSPIITNNYITNNSGGYASVGGIYCKNSQPFVLYNVISGNFGDFSAAGIHLITSSATIINNTIVGNNGFVQGNGILGENSSHATIINSIIWNHAKESIKLDSISTVNISYSIAAEIWNGKGNLKVDPKFVDALKTDYRLQLNSPSIDAGDPASLLDPDGTRADIGALFFNQMANSDKTSDRIGTSDNEINFNLLNNPLRFNSPIILNTSAWGHFSISLTSLSGQAHSLVSKLFSSGSQSIPLPNFLSPGIYFLKIVGESFSEVRKVVVD